MEFRREFLGAVAGGTALTALPTRSVRASQSAGTLTESVTVSADWDAPRVRFDYEYDVPDSVSSFAISAMSAGFTVESNGFERDGRKYVWDGTDSPRQTVFLDGDSSAVGDELTLQNWGYVAADSAFVWVPSLDVGSVVGDLDAVSRSRSFDGEGVVTPSFAFAGPNTTAREFVSDAHATLVFSDEVSRDIDTGALFEELAFQQTHLSPRRRYTDTALFVLPRERISPRGLASARDMVVSAAAVPSRSLNGVLPHEFAHVMFGTFGGGRMRWLTEASAEYYGRLTLFNRGLASFTEFHNTLDTNEDYDAGYTDIVLAQPYTWRDTSAHYRKGSQVLAALDAEIQRRSDGDYALIDVLADTSVPLTSYQGFENAVANYAGERMDDWLDQYVNSDGLPSVPYDPEYYVLPGVSRDTLDVSTTTESPTTHSTSTESATDPTTSTDASSGSTPGFGVGTGLAALVGGTVAALRKKTE
ncbi:PGF-CTERM sorting domain-containing protein [Salarchaeum japonicum]|uniref:PGF-CTERM sorting domain-containing protein n=1 Tax=Salarchaeum japonicum TaxID=555573 RepID=UPI003C725AC3